MWPTVLSDARFYELLQGFDEDLARQVKSEGCTCGGRLDSARYPRKPRGATVKLPEGYGSRESLCCAVEGCRCCVARPTTEPVAYSMARVAWGVVPGRAAGRAIACRGVLSRRVLDAARTGGALAAPSGTWARAKDGGRCRATSERKGQRGSYRIG